MNSEALRKHLAFKVRGWELIGDIYWGGGVAQSYESSWKPDENIEQVMECFDAIATEKIGWSLYLNCKPQQHVCEIYEWTHNGTKKTRLGVEVNHKKELAASIALAKATGWKE